MLNAVGEILQQSEHSLRQLIRDARNGEFAGYLHPKVSSVINFVLSESGVRVSNTVDADVRRSFDDGETHTLMALHQAGVHDAWQYAYHYVNETGRPLSMVEKEELSTFPLVGVVTGLLGGKPVARPVAKAHQARAIIRTQRANISIGILAEGTRRYGGIIGSLNDGGLDLARLGRSKILTAATFSRNPRSYLPVDAHTHFGAVFEPGEVSIADIREQLENDYGVAANIFRQRYVR